MLCRPCTAISLCNQFMRKIFFSFCPSAIFDSMYIVKRKILKNMPRFLQSAFFDSKYIVKKIKKSLPHFLQSAFSDPKYLV